MAERHQSRANRETTKTTAHCIWYGVCMSSCKVTVGNNEYLGPTAINNTYRFATDEREGSERRRERLEIIERENGA